LRDPLVSAQGFHDRLPQVAPAFGGTFLGNIEADILDNGLDQLQLIPVEALAPEAGDLLPVGELEPLPEELDAVEVWPVGSVPDHLDLVLVLGLLGRPLVDAGVVHEHGEGLVLAHPQPQS